MGRDARLSTARHRFATRVDKPKAAASRLPRDLFTSTLSQCDWLPRRSEYVELKPRASTWVHLIEEGPEPFSPLPTVSF
jgi:hypothetical protein